MNFFLLSIGFHVPLRGCPAAFTMGLWPGCVLADVMRGVDALILQTEGIILDKYCILSPLTSLIQLVESIF